MTKVWVRDQGLYFVSGLGSDTGCAVDDWDIRMDDVSCRNSSCRDFPVAQAVAEGYGQQVLSALHIWSDGQLIKQEEAFLTSTESLGVYSGWIVVE